MDVGLTNLNVTNQSPPKEVVLELLSFAGGENTIGTDQELENNEAELIENWDAISLGGIKRTKGVTKISDGGASYSEDMDLVIQHKDAGGTILYGIVEGDLVKDVTGTMTQDDDDAFTSGELCGAVSAGDKLWITNTTDNLQQKEVGVAIASPTDEPDTASARIYEHNFRLVAEGNTADTIYGSVAGTGNWSGANGWTTANNAWSIKMPEATAGLAPGFPSGTDITSFTKHDTYILYNIPNVVRRRLQNGIGCELPFSIARGNEGIFFVSNFPTLGVFLYDGTSFINLTINHDFVDDINLSARCFGTYSDQEYILLYNETGSGVSYPNKIKIYNTKFGRWKSRPLNSSVGDNLGYPAILNYTDNSINIGSSQVDKIYSFRDSSTSDNATNTEASYKTKIFTSRDFRLSTGGNFPIDNTRIKLTQVVVTHQGEVGAWALKWDTDRGKHTGSITFNFEDGEQGDLINTTFTVNTSNIISYDNTTDKRKTRTFSNGALGDEFQFEISNEGTGLRPEIKKIKIKGIILDEV